MAVGAADITVKSVYGTKTVTKTVSVSVRNEIADGITATLTNAYSDDYADVVVTNNDINRDGASILKLVYGRNNKPVENVLLKIRYTRDGGKNYTTVYEKTDASGVAYWYLTVPVSAQKVSYTVTPEDDATAVKEGTFRFGTIGVKPVQNVNGANGNDKTNGDGDKLDADYVGKGYNALVASTNDVKGTTSANLLTTTAGTYTKEANGLNTNEPQYVTQYVNSQQVDNKVGFIGGIPTIELPGEQTQLSQAERFEQPVDKTSGDYGTYASQSEYITLNVNPNELTYATMNFTSLKLSKYTKLVIEEYENEDKAKAGKAADRLAPQFEINGPHDQSNFSYQIPLSGKTNTLCIKVTLVSKGQVNTDTNKGYVIKDITGVYKKQDKKNDTTEVLKGAKITWSADTAKYSEEKPLDAKTLKDASVLADDTLVVTNSAVFADVASGKNLSKLTYSVPVFPYTGNAVIKAYDQNGVVVAYFACPTVNKATNPGFANENILNLGDDVDVNGEYNALATPVKNSGAKANYVYRISEEEATKSVGTVTQDGNLVTVESSKAGTTVLAGKITGVPGLDATNDTIYTSVQWNPVAKKSEENDGAVAFEGQDVKLTAQLVDKEQNPVASAGKGIKYSYTNGFTSDVSVLGSNDQNTNSKGQAELIVTASKGQVALTDIKVESKDSSYDAVLLVNGKQVKKLDLYWTEARPAFTPSAVSNSAVNPDEDAAKYTAAVVTGKAIATIGQNWQYGFETDADKLANVGIWANRAVTVHNAKIAVTAETGSKGTIKDAGNGSVYATSNQFGVTTLSAIVDGSAYDSNGVTFDVDGKATGIKSVGEGNAIFKNEQKLQITWKTDGQKGAFVSDLGYNAVSGQAINLYFKVSDKLGNALYDPAGNVKVDYQITGGVVSGGSVTSGSINVTSASGIAVIPVQQTASDSKTVVSVTYDGVTYKQIVAWYNAAVPTVNTGATINDGDVSKDNPYTTYSDGKKIVITFSENILASSVRPELFTVKRGTKEQNIGSVSVSGKTVTINFANAITDNDKTPFTVTVGTKKINDVIYALTTDKGATFTGDIENISASQY